MLADKLADPENISKLLVNHFMPNNCNINVINTVFDDRNVFIRMDVRTFKKSNGSYPTCLFDKGFFAKYIPFCPRDSLPKFPLETSSQDLKDLP